MTNIVIKGLVSVNSPLSNALPHAVIATTSKMAANKIAKLNLTY